jgi:hypothetical protein
MAFQLSPGVQVQEVDLTNVVPAVATTAGATAGHFKWGPIGQVVTVSTEGELARVFGEPDDDTFQYFFTAANFLAYGNNLQVVRAQGSADLNATIGSAGLLVKNREHYDTLSTFTNAGAFVAKYAGALGNSITISLCQSADAFSKANTATVELAYALEATEIDLASGANTLTVGDHITFEGHSTEYRITSIASTVVTLHTGLTTAIDGTSTPVNVSVKWRYADEFDAAPGTSAHATRMGGSNDEMHVIVIDRTGAISGTPNTVLEKFANVSVARDAQNSDGTTNFYKRVINDKSSYVWFADHYDQLDTDVDVTGTASTVVNAWAHTTRYPLYADFAHGADTASGSQVDADLMNAYALYANDELYDISLIPVGPASGVVAKYVVDNVAEVRKDCMVFLSPELTDDTVSEVTAFRDGVNINSSYAVMDSGWKYQYDRYNDTYRYVPLNGDVAGCAVRTDLVADAWFSPAGYNRGQIKNAVKLLVNPDKTDRDNLYKKQVNPVVSFPGQGIVLFGDKTMLTSSSAFDRINVRRLFIVLEKAIATAAKFQLFEFNDTFTRANFRNLVEPFLRDVQGRRGITDFKVVCDETNNTAEVIDGNEFVADIYIKPARSINFITLRFVATRTGISFEETGV